MKEAYAAGVATTAAGQDSAKLEAAQTKLQKAFGMNAFSLHFATDRFSAGHIRALRMELRTVCTSLTEGQPSAGLTANVQHDEDNINCLLVKDGADDKWWACGDHKYFDKENAQNRKKLRDFATASIAEVRAAFEDGKAGRADPTANNAVPASLSRLPTTEGLSPREALENTCPLFDLADWTKKDTTDRVVLVREDTSKINGMPRPPLADK
jgi:hypothetical protein